MVCEWQLGFDLSATLAGGCCLVNDFLLLEMVVSLKTANPTLSLCFFYNQASIGQLIVCGSILCFCRHDPKKTVHPWDDGGNLSEAWSHRPRQGSVAVGCVHFLSVWAILSEKKLINFHKFSVTKLIDQFPVIASDAGDGESLAELKGTIANTKT